MTAIAWTRPAAPTPSPALASPTPTPTTIVDFFWYMGFKTTLDAERVNICICIICIVWFLFALFALFDFWIHCALSGPCGDRCCWPCMATDSCKYCPYSGWPRRWIPPIVPCWMACVHPQDLLCRSAQTSSICGPRTCCCWRLIRYVHSVHSIFIFVLNRHNFFLFESFVIFA